MVKNKNITISVRNDFGGLKTILGSFFRDADESGGQTFAGVGKSREAVAVYCLKNQFVFHRDTLAVGDGLGKDFLRFFDRIFVELVQLAPVGLVVHQLVDATMRVAQSDLEGHDVVDVHLNFHFHVYRLQVKVGAVNEFFDFLFVFHENFVLTDLAHTADVVLFHRERVAENVGAFAAGDARATSNRQRASAAQIAEAEIVESHRHVLRFHWEQSI